MHVPVAAATKAQGQNTTQLSSASAEVADADATLSHAAPAR